MSQDEEENPVLVTAEVFSTQQWSENIHAILSSPLLACIFHILTLNLAVISTISLPTCHSFSPSVGLSTSSLFVFRTEFPVNHVVLLYSSSSCVFILAKCVLFRLQNTGY